MLYVFYGSDSFSRREALRDLKSRLDGDGSLVTNTLVLDARQASVQEIIAACDTVPFLGEHRLVIVEGLLQQAARAGGGRRRGKGAASVPSDAWQPLAEYAAHIPPSTVLVLLDSDVPPNDPLLKALSQHGEARRFDLPDQKALPAWIDRRAKAAALRIEPAAVRLLADLVGPDLWQLAGELEKLSIYANGQPVREDDVRSLVSRVREEKAWALTDAIVERRPAQALRALAELQQHEHPQLLLATIQGRFRRLAIARELMGGREPASRIGERVGLQGYALERLLDQASRYSMPEIRAAYDRLVQADAEVKRGLVEEQLSMELLVNDLATPRRGRAA